MRMCARTIVHLRECLRICTFVMHVSIEMQTLLRRCASTAVAHMRDASTNMLVSGVTAAVLPSPCAAGVF